MTFLRKVFLSENKTSNETNLNLKSEVNQYSADKLLNENFNNIEVASNENMDQINSKTSCDFQYQINQWKNENKFKPSHQRTRSDTTGITKSFLNNRVSYATNSKTTIGDLKSGKAFDIHCICTVKQMIDNYTINKNIELLVNRKNFKKMSQEFQNNENILQKPFGNKIENSNNLDETLDDSVVNKNSFLSSTICKCNSIRIEPELEFTKALVAIGKKLVRFSSKEHKSKLKKIYKIISI